MQQGIVDRAVHRFARAQPLSAEEVTAEQQAPVGSLSHRVASGAVWLTASRLGTQVLQFGVGLVLARLLAPADFGLVASVYTVTNFSTLFFEFGLGAALIHKAAPSERDKSTVFWINALSGVVFLLVLWLMAPWVADFFGAPQLEELLPVTALSLTFALGVVHSIVLERELRVRQIAVFGLVAAAAGNVVSVVAALAGAGAMAIAVGAPVSSAVMSVLLFVAVRWRPRHFISRDSVRSLWNFSSGVMGANFIGYWGTNSDNLLIGRFVGAAPLGFYNRAYNLMLLPVNQVIGALGGVVYPALAAMREDEARVRAAYLRCLGALAFVGFPILVGLAAVSEAAVPVLWGDQWDGVVPILQVLCLAGVARSLEMTTGWVFQARGRTRIMFVMSVVATVAAVTGMVVGLQGGALGVAWGLLVAWWVTTPVVLAVAGSVIGLRFRTMCGSFLPAFAASAVMGVVVWLVPGWVGLARDSAPALGVQLVTGAVLYGVLGPLLARAAFRDVRELLLRRRGAAV